MLNPFSTSTSDPEMLSSSVSGMRCSACPVSERWLIIQNKMYIVYLCRVLIMSERIYWTDAGFTAAFVMYVQQWIAQQLQIYGSTVTPDGRARQRAAQRERNPWPTYRLCVFLTNLKELRAELMQTDLPREEKITEWMTKVEKTHIYPWRSHMYSLRVFRGSLISFNAGLSLNSRRDCCEKVWWQWD